MPRRLLLYLFAVGVFLLPASSLHARERVQGWCEQGNQTVTTVGIVSTSVTQGSFPSCTVTVWDTGTMDVAAIFSDDVGTIKANPFTADSNGLWFFYADNARYDIQFSGGGIASPFTLADWLVADTAQMVTTISAVTFSATPVFDVGKASILTITLTGNVTSSTITNAVTGQVVTFHIAQDATGGRTFVWPTDAVLRTGTLVVADDASAVTTATFYYTGTEWREIGIDSDEVGRNLVAVNNAVQNLGSLTSRWNGIFGQTLDIAGTSTLTGAVTTDLIPSTTGQDLGSAAARWNAFLETVTFYNTMAPNVTGVDFGSATARPDVFIELGTFYNTFAPNTTGVDIGTASARPDGIFDVMTVGLWNSVPVVDGNKFPTIQAAHDALPSTGGTILVVDGDRTLTAVLTISKPTRLILGVGTISCGMADPGIASGCINITANDVEIVGRGSLSVLTQPNAQNIQTMIWIGTADRVTLRHFKIDGNEDNQTIATPPNFYTGIRSAFGSQDITIEYMDITRAGNRAIDLRAPVRAWVEHNYIHQNGVNIAGQGTAESGNALSIDIDGTNRPREIWVQYNLFENWGDSVAAADGSNIHFNYNTLRGRADFGLAVHPVESGIDFHSVLGGEVIGNILRNVRGITLSCITLAETGANQACENVQISSNTFFADNALLSSSDQNINIGDPSALGDNGDNITFTNNNLQGVRLSVTLVDGLTISGNNFRDYVGNAAGSVAAIELGGATANVTQFNISGNTFHSTDASILRGINFGVAVDGPGTLGLNQYGTLTGADVFWQAGSGGSVAIAAQSGSLTTGSIAASGTASIVVVWPFAFPDTSYNPVCSVVENTASTNTLRIHHLRNTIVGQIAAFVVNDDAGAAHTGTVHCIARRP